MHRAARIEDAFHDFRAKRARRRGFLSTVVPYTGYGAPTWARILGPCRSRTRAPAGQPRGARQPQARGEHPGLEILHQRPGERRDGHHRDRGHDPRGAPGPRRSHRCRDPRPARAGVAHRPHVHGGFAGRCRVARLHRRPVRDVRRDLGHRRHGHGDRSPPPLPGVLEHLRTRRARACSALRGWRCFSNGSPRRIREHRSSTCRPAPGTSRRRSSGSSRATSSLQAPCCSPTGARRTIAGSAAGASTRSRASCGSQSEFPGLRWLLVGDDGQHDEIIYGEFTTRAPGERLRGGHPPAVDR